MLGGRGWIVPACTDARAGQRHQRLDEKAVALLIINSAVAVVVKAILGADDTPEVVLTSPFVPGTTRGFTNPRAYNEDIANARIYAGFHYRFSTTVVGRMGDKPRAGPNLG